MKNRTLLIFLVLIAWETGLGQEIPRSPNLLNQNGSREGIWTVLYTEKWQETADPDSVKYYRIVTYSNGIPVGTVKDYYLSGKIQFEGKLFQVKPEMDDGVCYWYYENGTIWEKAEFANGIPVGEFLVWFANGNKAIEYTYVNGKMNGIYRDWFESGELMSLGEFKDDAKEGEWMEHNDKLYRFEGNYVHNIRQGEWKVFNPNGSLKGFQEYNKKGKMKLISFRKRTSGGNSSQTK